MAQKPSLGGRIRKLRLKAGISLRELARRVKVSAAHLSDVENDRRTPSDDLLRRITEELSEVGAEYEELRLLKPVMEKDVEAWYEDDPVLRVLLREARDSPFTTRQLLEQLRAARREAEKEEK